MGRSKGRKMPVVISLGVDDTMTLLKHTCAPRKRKEALSDSSLLITATKLPTEQEHRLPVQGSSHAPTAAAEAPSLFRCGLGPSGTKSFQRGCSFLKGKCWPVSSQRRSSQTQHLCRMFQRSLVSPASQLPHPEVNAESRGRRRCPCNCW